MEQIGDKMPLFNKIRDKKHIIWDWNGTILNDVDHAVDTMNGLLSESNLNLIDKEKYKTLFEFPVKKYYDKLGFDYNLRSFENLCHDFVDRFMAGFSSCDPFGHIKDVLQQTKKVGKIQSVLSATDQENLENMVEHFDFNKLFDFVYGIDNKLAGSKTYRGKQLIDEANISLADTVLIGDTLHDLEVGEELGIDVILVPHGHQCEQILKSKHQNVVRIF